MTAGFGFGRFASFTFLSAIGLAGMCSRRAASPRQVNSSDAVEWTFLAASGRPFGYASVSAPPRSSSTLTASWIMPGFKSRIDTPPISRIRDSASCRYRSRVFGSHRSAAWLSSQYGMYSAKIRVFHRCRLAASIWCLAKAAPSALEASDLVGKPDFVSFLPSASLAAMRLQGEGAPNAAHCTQAQSRLGCQRTGAPMSGVLGCRFQGHGQHPLHFDITLPCAACPARARPAVHPAAGR